MWPLCVCVHVCVFMCVCQACELLQAERGRVERLAQIVCEQRSQLDSCPEATKEPLQEQLARVSTHSTPHARMHRKIQRGPKVSEHFPNRVNRIGRVNLRLLCVKTYRSMQAKHNAQVSVQAGILN